MHIHLNLFAKQIVFSKFLILFGKPENVWLGKKRYREIIKFIHNFKC